MCIRDRFRNIKAKSRWSDIILKYNIKPTIIQLGNMLATNFLKNTHTHRKISWKKL